MERLFSPCTRYRDMLESQGRLELFRGHTEQLNELNLEVSTEELLSAERAFAYADLLAMSGNQSTVLWLTPHAAVARLATERRHHFWFQLRHYYWLELNRPYRFIFSADGKGIVALARSPEHLLEICDVVLRLLARSVVSSVKLHSWNDRVAWITAPNLASLMEQCPSLKVLSLQDLRMDENHCRVLGAFSRKDLEINLKSCILTRAGANALVEVLGRNQGPTEINHCNIDCFVLLNGLRGNSRLKSLAPRLFDDRGRDYQERLVLASSCSDGVNRQALAIAGMLKKNTGLIVCDLIYCVLTNKTWNAVCDSLKAHPTLQVLSLRWPMQPLEVAPLALAVAGLKSPIQALVDMLKVNTSIHTIRLTDRNCREIIRGEIFPYLESNRLRPRVHAIQTAHPMAYRAKILGRALNAVRTDANSLWMLLSGNPEAAFLSTIATTTPATNLPTPAATAATFYS
jgi:hypothetical protein